MIGAGYSASGQRNQNGDLTAQTPGQFFHARANAVRTKSLANLVANTSG